MALRFAASSHQYWIADRTPVTAFPIIVGFWANATFAGNGGGNNAALGFGQSGANNSAFAIGNDGSPEWWLRRNNTSGFQDELDLATGVVANTDNYILAQISAANNCRLYMLGADGIVRVVQSTASVSPTGINQMTIGSFPDGNDLGNDSYDGTIGEIFVSDFDFGYAGQIDAALIHLLARDGPFGCGDQIADSVVWSIPGRGEGDYLERALADHYVRNGPQPIWTNVAGADVVPDIAGSTMQVDPDEALAVGTV